MAARSGWRRVRRNLWNLVALLIIVAALGAGVVQLGLPWLVRNPQRVEQWLSARLERPVTIGSVSSRWLRGGPELALENVEIGAAGANGASLHFDRAALALNPFAIFQRNGAWNEFRLSGLELSLSHDSDGRWSLRGLDLPTSPANKGDGLGALGALVLEDLVVHLDDPQHAVKVDLAASELRLINRSAGPRVLGKIRRVGSDNPPLDIVIDSSPDHRRGNAWIGGQGLDLAALASRLPLDDIRIDRARGAIDAWASWDDGALREVSVKFELADVRMQRIDVDALPAVDLDALSGVARFRLDAGGWDIDVADWRLARPGKPLSEPARFAMRRSGEPAQWLAGADRIDIAGLAPLATLAPGVPDGLRRWLADAVPQGVLDHPRLRYDSADAYQLSTGFSGLAATAVGHIPGVSSLSGSIVGDAEATLVSIPKQPMQLDFPGVFRTPFRYSEIGGDVVAWHEDDGWQVKTGQLAFEGEGYGGILTGGVSFPIDRSQPALDVALALQHADIGAAKLFWPVNVMPPKAVQWLDDALVHGSLTTHAVFRGNLEDFPFHNDEGRFEAIAELDDLQMRFHPDWPTADHVNATATFANRGVDVDVHSGETVRNRLLSAHASIEELGKVVVEVQAKAQGRGADLLAYLRATPIGRDNATGLEGLSIGGRGDVDLKLHIPVAHSDQITLSGDVQMRAAPLASSKWDLQLDDGNGLVHFDQHGVQAKSFAVQHDGNPGTLTLAIGAAVSNDANTLELALDVPLTVQQLLQRVPNVAFLGDTIKGRSDWDIAVSIPKDSRQQPTQLTLSSKLVGTTIDLPAPIGKDAAAARSLSIVLPLPAEGREYRLDYDGVLTHIGRVPRADQPYAGRLDLGSKVAGAMPDAGIVIGGRARELDATGWIAFAVGLGGGGSGAGLRSVDVHADALVIGDSRVPDVDVTMSFAAAGTHVELAGASVQGSVDIPGDLARAGVTVHLPVLHWPASPDDAKPDDAAETRSPFAPSTAPPMHIWVGDLRVGKAEFGETRIETRPTAAGMRIDTLDARSPMFHLAATGDWNGGPANSQTRLDLELTAPDLGHVLDGFGFKGLIDGGPTEAQLSGSWPGSPVAFALSRLTGTLKIDVGQGRFLEVDPGAGGRLFGLLSLGEIRRRLALDFTDFYKSGTTFNSIKGQFDLDGASARTNNLLIDSPAAQVLITGRTGLKARDYDQEMTVTPKAGVALPVVGAIAGGPVGAAAGLVVQNLFRKQIGAATHSRYKVSGSWDKPEIDLIAREPVGGKASTDAPAPVTEKPEPRQ